MTHGRSYLSLLRESYQKSGLKREKIIVVNLKVAFIAGLCLCWLLSFLLFLALVFLLFLASVFSSCSCFCLFFLLSNIIGKCQIFFILFFLSFSLSSTHVNAFLSSTLLPHTSFQVPLFFHLHLLKFHFLPLTSFHVPLSSTYI